MQNFEGEYKLLNSNQKQAVDTIDGPLLVIAGPGTGKTQLLSARVAQILKKTDTLPQNILCLTFTENGAENMRERLTRFIGSAAYDVTISTYHAFGGDLITRYPEYFTETRLQNPVDDLGRHQILSEIVEGMSYLNPLKQTRHHLGDLISTISEVKRALLTSKDLLMIARENSQFISEANKQVEVIFDDLKNLSTKLDTMLPYFERTQQALKKLVPTDSVNAQFGSLAAIALNELEQAIDEAEAINKTTPLTRWKNNWLAKNSDNKFIFDGQLQNKRIEALAATLDQYQEALTSRGLYDFDDMIIRAIEALENNDDLKYSLQEKYLYILLDEFQDTNTAQLRLVQLLSDNPVHEGRPNVMAVGDDDQAIYAFQGAQYSNMLDFHNMYRDTKVVNLTHNYRSHADVLHTAHNIAEQIDQRLHHKFKDMSKTLTAANLKLPPSAFITRSEFLSDISQYDWIANEIDKLIKVGISPREIAVLAPRHKQLEPLVPFLNARGIPVRYEKRENILEAPVIKQLITMSRLVLALQQNDEATANALWPEILSFEFWQIPTSTLWQVSWKVNDQKDSSRSWSKALLDESACREPALLILTLAHKAGNESVETMLDYLTGTEPVTVNEPDTPTICSPLRDHYASKQVLREQPELFYETLSHLKVLRTKLREHQATVERTLVLDDLIAFVQLYEAAGQQMINTSPYNQKSDAVQLMTVFKAKGLEFEHVFLPCCQDDVWGGSSRGNSNKLTLPANLAPIRHAGANDDERLRILFVALTRAKVGLYLTSYTHSYSGKTTKRLKYLNEQQQADGSFAAGVLPKTYQTIVNRDHSAPQIEQFDIDWRARHISSLGDTQLKDLLQQRLKNYKLSPTHVNSFTDTEYGGPEKFFFNTLLRFPQAPTADGQFGNAIHESLEWVQHQVTQNESLPSTKDTLTYFAARMRSKKLPQEQTKLLIERGKHALKIYLSKRGSMFTPNDKAEHNFSSEGVLIDNVHMSGKIDRLEINHTDKTIAVVDYKTGKSYEKWKSESKLHKYKQQLYCYKLLVENSHTFAGYTVNECRLEFVEPDNNNQINSLILPYKDKEYERVTQLISVIWGHVMNLNLPDINKYQPNLTGIRAFEQDLLDESI